MKSKKQLALAKKLPDGEIEFARELVCCIHTKVCVTGACFKCPGIKKYQDIMEFISSVPEMKIQQWVRVDKKVRKKEIKESGTNVAKLLKEKVEDKDYIVHVYSVFRQFKELKMLKEKLKPGEVIVSVDFSRNYDNKQANEIQSAYFGHDTFTLYTVCCYWKNDKGELVPMSLGIVSNEANHDRNVAYTNNLKVIEILRVKVKGLKVVYFWSDGCASQFRSRFVFKSIMFYPSDLEICWDYGEVSHFKGPHDGIGGTIKRCVYRAVQQNKVIINTAREFADAANNFTKIEVVYVDKSEIEHPEVDDAPPITGTLKIHHVKRTGEHLDFKINSPYFVTDEPTFKKQCYGAEDIDVSIDDQPSTSGNENVSTATSSEPTQAINQIVELKVGEFYRVKYQFQNKKGDTVPKILMAQMDSIDNNGAKCTFLKCVSQLKGKNMFELDVSVSDIVSLDNILSHLPQPNISRRGLLFWDGE